MIGSLAHAVVAACAGLSVALLAACGQASGTAADGGAGLQATAGAAQCAPGADGRTCDVTVSYRNSSADVVVLEPGATLLVDSQGDVHRGVARPVLQTPMPVPPGQDVSIVWTTTIPGDAVVDRVMYTDDAGVVSTLALRTVVAAPPSPTPTPVVTTAPVVVPSPTAKPAPSVARPTPAPTRTRARPPSPSPSSAGSIG